MLEYAKAQNFYPFFCFISREKIKDFQQNEKLSILSKIKSLRLKSTVNSIFYVFAIINYFTEFLATSVPMETVLLSESKFLGKATAPVLFPKILI